MGRETVVVVSLLPPPLNQSSGTQNLLILRGEAKDHSFILSVIQRTLNTHSVSGAPQGVRTMGLWNKNIQYQMWRDRHLPD